MRPLMTTVLTPRARHSCSRFGQISVSIMTNSRGLTMSRTRRTMIPRSIGKKKTPSAIWKLCFATCWPVIVVVETKSRRWG